jgi:hypothetical protein
MRAAKPHSAQDASNAIMQTSKNQQSRSCVATNCGGDVCWEGGGG